DEGNFSIGITEYFSGPPQAPQTPDAYQSAINASFGANASAVLAEYPLSDYGNNTQLAYNRVSTDPSACRSLHVEKLWAQRVPLYAYEFNYEDAPYYFPQMPGFKAGAAHTIDIQFLFPNWHGGPLGVNLDQSSGKPRELNNQESKLSDQLVAAWTNFAKTGNPNGKGNSPWPRFTTNAQTFLSQNLQLSTLSATDYRTIYKCDFWDPLLTY
ncbi:MAG TPA: carboxylesterase family protein, partial [Hyphomicrobium sp.]|nr:carboxylesterase family protein [Hyphomicrobium sp.]